MEAPPRSERGLRSAPRASFLTQGTVSASPPLTQPVWPMPSAGGVCFRHSGSICLISPVLQAKVSPLASQGRTTVNDPRPLVSSLGSQAMRVSGAGKAHFPKPVASGLWCQNSLPNACNPQWILRFAILSVMAFCECLG